MVARSVSSRSGGAPVVGRDLSYQLVQDRRGRVRGLVRAAVAGALIAAVVLVPLTVWLTELVLGSSAPAPPPSFSSAVAGVGGSPAGDSSPAGFWFVETKGL